MVLIEEFVFVLLTPFSDAVSGIARGEHWSRRHTGAVPRSRRKKSKQVEILRHKNPKYHICCHQMYSFKLKMHQNNFQPELRLGPRWEAYDALLAL